MCVYPEFDETATHTGEFTTVGCCDNGHCASTAESPNKIAPKKSYQQKQKDLPKWKKDKRRY